MSWEVPNIWDGGTVWILGGGPSVTKQFNIPEDVVKRVINKTSTPSVYSPYMERLHNQHVIGINISYMIGSWIDMCFFGDVGFFLRNKTGLAEFPGIKITCHARVSKYNWVKYLPQDTSKRTGISSDPRRICWNANSGAAAISVAANAGAKRIILLGFDMQIVDNKQHWHNQYDRIGALDSKGREVLPPFTSHLIGFPYILQDAKKRGIEILNACPDSAITCFKKVNVKDII
jgi:hypothetical protein